MKSLTVLIRELKSNEWIYRGLEKTGRLVETEAKKLVPVVNAILKMSISHEVVGNTVYIGTNNPYARYVEYGTGIYARNGDGRKTGWSYIVRGAYADKYWREGAKNCFIDAEGNKRIWTRGQKPQPFLERALANKTMEILEVFGASAFEAEGSITR